MMGMQGRIMIWSVPPCKGAGAIRAVWFTPDRDPCMVINAVPLSHVPAMKGVWSPDTSTGASDGQFGACKKLCMRLQFVQCLNVHS